MTTAAREVECFFLLIFVGLRTQVEEINNLDKVKPLFKTWACEQEKWFKYIYTVQLLLTTY